MKSLLRSVIPRRWWEAARQAKIGRSVKAFPRRVVEHNYAGEKLRVLIADGISEGWYDHDWDDLTELRLLASGRLRPGATVFDLGAHQGVVALMLANRVAPDGRVVAVEGMRHNCDVARENVALNHNERVEIRHAVVADASVSIRFFDGLNGSVARDGVGHEVEAVTIDQLAAERGTPDVVFLDIEGFEAKALVGAARTLARPCDWFVEVHVGCGLENYGGSAPEVLAMFPESRYRTLVWKLGTDETPRSFKPGDDVIQDRFALVALAK